LPDSTTRFIGREAEIAEVSKLLTASRLVAVVGPGGCGKTRFALEVLRRRTRSKPDAARFVDLSGITDTRVVEAAVARGLGLAATLGRTPLDALEGDIGRVLLLIDNCEHLVAECARIAERLLAGSRDLRMMVTSREVLGVPYETVWTMPPLTPDEAIRLFAERARSRRHTFAISSANGATVAEICRRLDRMPLAIELAASRIGSISSEEILERLDDRFALLSDGARTAADRHRTLRATVEWSYALLEPDEQRLFGLLAVFRGGFDLAAVEAVGGGGALDRLSRLVDKSLVTVIGEPMSATRYAMLETLVEYGQERLREAGELESARQTHLDHFLIRAEAAFAERSRSGSAAQLHRLDSDLDNLRTALDWSLQSDPCAGVRLIAATREIWFRFGQAEGLRAARQLLERCPDRNEATAWALLTAGNLALTQLQHQDARNYLETAAQIGTEVGAPAVRGWSAWMRGVDQFLAENHEAARGILEEGVALNRQTRDPIGLGLCLASLGTVHLRLGNRSEAIARLSEGLDLLDESGDRWGAGFCHTYLGIAHLAAADRASADRHFRQAIALLGPIRDVTMLSLAVGGLGEIAAPSDWPRAMRLAGAASGLRERFGGPFPPWIAAEVDDLHRRGRAAIGTEAGDRWWDAGFRLDTEAAVALSVGSAAPAGRKAGPLSPRETEIGRLVAEGLSNAAIAGRLHVSTRTVENHVLHILNKLGAANRTQVATWIKDRG
jgi:predicted ATPase/DNA-binding CsgD family transcriptional regulator